LLAQVFAVAAVTTAVLSLDATVVLLTPVVFVTAARLQARARPPVYACGHLANSASLLLPGGTSLPALLAVAALAAALANLINNLPAVLVLLPLAAPSGAGAVLAVLVGVNIGPNLTYTGSLATLLWRRVVHQHRPGPSLRSFTALGLLTVPAGLITAVLALWAALHALGG